MVIFLHQPCPQYLVRNLHEMMPQSTSNTTGVFVSRSAPDGDYHSQSNELVQAGGLLATPPRSANYFFCYIQGTASGFT
jgi:hypothetical protein